MLRIYICVAVLLAALSGNVYAQQDARRELVAFPLQAHITLDGKLDEQAWAMAPKATEFTQVAPRPGENSAQRTAVSILYDDEAVYVGAMIYERNPDSIVKQLSPRDDFENSNTDAFGVSFDTYFDKQNATQFVVTAAGVQADGIQKFDGVDRSWNAAWHSRVSYNDSGWCVEMKIPYSALRFAKKEVQLWGVNFLRVIRRHRERSYWNRVSPAITNVVGQEGMLSGLAQIQAPLRLALLPYLSAYTEDYNGARANTLNGGMDIKYGVSESFTLDMTLVPDFGQTLYDNRVLNLSPIEVRYDERRYFFTEGVDLFNKNDLFYSRRVGGTPVNAGALSGNLDSNEVMVKSPLNTRLYNAAKFSGRTRGKTGIGIFNAVAAPAAATVRDTITGVDRHVQTAPFTNYSVLVVDQALKNNSYISVVNTNVNRAENSYNANVSAVLFKFADKDNRYGVSGSGDMSRRYFPGNTDVGYRGALSFGKQRGNYTWSMNMKSVSDRFNPNDLGYLDRNNIVSAILYNVYNTYKPFWKINTTYNKIGLEYYRSYNPDAFSRAAIHGNHNITFSSFHTVGAYWDATPAVSYDYFEPRTKGRFYELPANHMVGGFISSDYRRKFAIDLEGSKRWYGSGDRHVVYADMSPRFRFSEKLSAVYSISKNAAYRDVGFVNKLNDSIYLGTRNLHTLTNSLSAAYIFTARMSLRLEGRHYWSQAGYSKYGLLGADGKLIDAVGYTKKHDINYNSFNVFLNFVWQFRPGSEMSVVYQNSVYATGQMLANDYAADINSTFQAPQSNSLSMKVIYFLDYQTLAHAFKRKEG